MDAPSPLRRVTANRARVQQRPRAGEAERGIVDNASFVVPARAISVRERVCMCARSTLETPSLSVAEP